jgi:hypothetical protein
MSKAMRWVRNLARMGEKTRNAYRFFVGKSEGNTTPKKT